MGSEIEETRFSREDVAAFQERLRDETDLLGDWLRDGRLEDAPPRTGLELEAWLVDRQFRPAPVNAAVLDALPDAALSPELAQYNLELNTTPRPLAGRPFSSLLAEMRALWDQVDAAAQASQARLTAVGILPTVTEEDLCVARMSGMRRYQALNDQVLALRNQRPLEVRIEGDRESVHLRHSDVMLESAATSLQLHLQVSPARAARVFNASVAVSAATVAVSANAPLLFGRLLWEETRIPLFEQAVAVGDTGPLARVGFGSGYARDPMYGFFVENRQHFPVLLPVHLDEPRERLPHLVLHNGTVWRWNRPLVGFDDQNRCHLRVEHRVMSAGPTLADITANAAFYYGLAQALADWREPVESRLPFQQAERNFYAAARHGLAARVTWLEHRGALRELVLQRLLPEAARGLREAGVDPEEAEAQLGVIRSRVETGRTGAAWQRAWIERHGRDLQGLVAAYLERQADGRPVHEWHP